MSDQSLSGKTCLVTGGASGLGKAIATKFLESGANVVICDINQDRLDQTSNELSEKGPLKTVSADITQSESVQSLFETITQTFGKLDILVNNAGIMDRYDPVGDLDENLWEKVMAVNLTAPFLLSKLAVNNMLEHQTSGSIVNIVSVAGKAGWSGGAAYTASKHGLVGLTKNTASFYGDKGIRCNALMVGAMNTNISDAFGAGVNQEGQAKLYGIMGGIRPPMCNVNDVADVCLSLTAGKGAGIINGACISADGGWTGMVG